MDEKTIAMTIVGMGVVTYLPRLLPLLLLSRRREAGGTLSPLFEAWLRYVPPAVLAAMLLPALLVADGQIALEPDTGIVYLCAAVPTLLVARKTRSLIGPVLVGVAMVALGRLWVG
jgi:branched-subunit amino acid transport protein